MPADAAGRWQERAAVTGPKNPRQPGEVTTSGGVTAGCRWQGGRFGGRTDREDASMVFEGREARAAAEFRSAPQAGRPPHQVAHEVLAGRPDRAGPGTGAFTFSTHWSRMVSTAFRLISTNRAVLRPEVVW